MFFKGSRYAHVDEDILDLGDNRVIRYKKIRYIPDTEPRLGHRVAQWERLDHIAQRYFRNPERFWRICDANRAMYPGDLVAEPGRKIVIPSTED
jgi:hypothetical protein